MTHGYVRSEHKESLLKRLKRIEGQVRGIQAMEDQVRQCVREGGERRSTS
jgi:DNA-binding FrmR family transcriptional regulator